MKIGSGGRLSISIVLVALLAGCESYQQRQLAHDEFERAQREQQMGRPNEAIDALQWSTQANPDFVPAHTLLGDLYKQQGDYDRAAQQYESAAKLEPKVASHWFNLAVMDQVLGRLNQAADDYLQSLKLQPTDSPSNMNLGLVYLSLGDNQRAIEYLQKATTADRKSIKAWTNLGVALDSAGDHRAAERAYRQSLELDGDKMPVLLNYGGNLISQNRPEVAISILQQAIDLQDGPLAEKRMGDAMVEKGWFDAAADRYHRAVKFNPRYVSAYNALAENLIKQYVKGLQLNDAQRARAVEAWKTSFSLRADQPDVKAAIDKWDHP